MNKTMKRAIATAAMVLAAFTAQADSRGRHDERNWRSDGGHYDRDYRDYRDHRGGRDWRRHDDRRWHGHRHRHEYRHRRGADRHYWRGYDHGRRYYRDDRYYRGGYRGDRVYYGRHTYADIDLVIHVPLW